VLREEVERLRSLLREVAQSGYTESRISGEILVIMSPELWARVKEAAK
jgi:hypothetical protein